MPAICMSGIWRIVRRRDRCSSVGGRATGARPRRRRRPRRQQTPSTSPIGELQAGWDGHNAEVSNPHFAAGVVWRQPFAATGHGYADLHAIHVRLKEQGRGPDSWRYEVVRVMAPAPGVGLAQVRWLAPGPDGEPIGPTSNATGPFSGMALYVLVRRGETWWLTAGAEVALLIVVIERYLFTVTIV